MKKKKNPVWGPIVGPYLSEDPGPHDVFFSLVRWDGGWATQDGRRRRRRRRWGDQIGGIPDIRLGSHIRLVSYR